ncbi:MAG: Fe-S assembly protein IscX [Betaproteobacteria bacterium]|nr:Fe-S assembly protein IscX [Betaproteobacteria bacterium]
MKWTDVLELAIALSEAHPEVDPRQIRFTDLHRWVIALPQFDDDPKNWKTLWAYSCLLYHSQFRGR